MAGPVNEHSLTNDAIKAIIAQYGNRLKFIKTENNTVAVNQKIIGSPVYIDASTDIVYKNYDGYDFIQVKGYDPFNGKVYTSLIRTHDIRTFVIADNDYDVLDGFRC